MLEPSRHPRGFTIIELLVTIAIIAVLVAIATPAILKANTAAQEVKCLTNIRSIGQATLLYTNDHTQNFPVGLGNDLNLLNLVGKRGTNNGIGGVEPEDRLLYDYVNQQTDIAACPLDIGFDNSLSCFDLYGSSYLYMDSNTNSPTTRYRGRNDIWSLEGHRTTRVTAPKKKMLIGEATVIRASSNPNHHWHNDEANLKGSMSFVDGHAEVVEHKTDENGRYRNYNRATIEGWATQDDYY
ncbi:prepilin-type N-terminal cleavage/methylation domain-containing protein [Algisphaera agarilytica]|uniref:Prepilin-type N-terminal cleavage/methylation domain-containing protein n=1 Tax=Algisphaera agarilytica TaxID=1385975 RepID=A0A7X0H3D5_9BACT|nr:prepilin-type N-terminal cleavage/methylation domain-containing protein [Algisphaera agarilytica]